MAGGNFDPLAGKVRPGTYINIESARNDPVGVSERGTVLIPLIGHDYGPVEFIKLSNAAPDAAYSKLGYSVYDTDSPSMLLIREAFKNTANVIVCVLKEGAKATKEIGNLTVTAKYGGSRGNDIKIAIVENPVSGFDLQVYLGTKLVNEFTRAATVAALGTSDWVTFSGTGALAANSGTNLAGGTDGVATGTELATFLDSSEGRVWNTMAFPNTDSTFHAAVKSKIKYLRENVGKYRKAVLPEYAGDYEGIINVTNSVKLADGTELTTAQATAFVAGLDAGASYTESNTYAKYEGAIDIVGPKSHAEAIAAINAGEFFFSFSEAGEVVVEYDINSLTTFIAPKDKTWRKNRVLRVHDSFSESIMLNFPPNKYDNDPTGWDVMEGVGKTLLMLYEKARAIKNVDYEADFLVDRSKSSGDETYFIVGLQAVDSSEKQYFTVTTR